MKINSNYKLREIAGETVIVKQGQVGSDLTRIISLNSSARVLYERMNGREFSLKDAADALVEVYGIDASLAELDAAKWASDLKGCGIIEE